FDEPTIGLHPHDIERMNNLLLQLRDKTLAPAQRRSFADEVMALARGYENARVLVNDDQELA
ncbi:MAG TPA: hypothetical protein DHV85_08335, partial [Candidatus Accumulibacter sp.]|nr:hypothetical protein [Accumulibacter sp.]